MSFISSMFDPSKGAGFQATGAPIQTAVTPEQLAASYGQSQSGIAQQQAFVNALQSQNGIGNQNALANMLSQQAQGQGPNPAQAQLNQATGQNVANQAALMAGQRGTSANPGMMARLAAQQGAGIQQQAVGQGAIMNAQQQLAAQQQLGQLSGQQVAQQQGALGQYNQAAQGQQSNLLGAMGQQNASNVAMQSNMNTANAGIAGINAEAPIKLIGSIASGAGSAATAGAKAHGGMITEGYAQGGGIQSPGQQGPKSFVGQYLQQMSMGGHVPGVAKTAGDSLKNDTVPAMLSPGEIVIPKSITQSSDAVNQSAKFVAAVLAQQQRKK